MSDTIQKCIILLVCVLLMSVSGLQAQDFCEGNFDYDKDVDGSDASTFKQDFGRSSLLNPCPADGPAPVAKTGQTTCFYESGDVASCQLVITRGQDGNRRGVAWPNPRFTDNGDGTVTDNLTGLIWLKNANCFGLRGWNNALSDCNGLNNGECGLTDGSTTLDWRLPNRFEMESLLDLQYLSPAVSNTAGTGQWSAGNPFNNVQNSNYWSSTTYADIIFTVNAWGISLSNGLVQHLSKSTGLYVWPVRGGHR